MMRNCAGNEEGARRGAVPVLVLLLSAALFLSATGLAQQPAEKVRSSHPSASPTARVYPKEIRGYKVERARVEIKKREAQDEETSASSDADALIQLGEPRVASLSPLGITLEIPVTVAAVKQGGRVDFLTFEDMTVNGTSVTVNEYRYPFDLPNTKSITLPEPIRIHVSTPRALWGALGEWSQPKEVWPVVGRVYVFGRFKKFLFKFKRVVPVELNLSFKNPLRK
ncbi:MAG TPA: hypothetical protein VJT09_12485 [Pyrinomonadaceae bacterium]|nr:hypothetical protein [Pyrinomonadaceae bacterium]